MNPSAPDESDPFQPFMAILAERGMVPFQREPWVNPYTGRVEPWVLGERPTMRWRVATDTWGRLRAWFRDRYNADPAGLATLAGWPIEPDSALPSGAIVFEVESADRRVVTG